MERNFETVMIEQCAPALAGLKAAALFRHETGNYEALAETVARWNALLNGRGVKLTILKQCRTTNRHLIYVYRPAKLQILFEQGDIQAFLRQEGYTLPAPGEDFCAALLPQLAQRLNCGGEFPHEIGVFLGYPLCDVVGFIRHRGKNFTCSGCWKAYGDPAAAQRLFAQLNKCTAVYLRLFHRGTAITRLTVAV